MGGRVRLIRWCMAAQMLAGGASGAPAASSEALVTREPARSAEPSGKRYKPGTREMALVGALAGVGLGATLGDRSGAAHAPLRPLGATDAILSGAALALFATPHLFDRAPPVSSASGPPRELNGFDRKMRHFAVGHRSAAGRELLDTISTTTLTATVLAPVGVLAASDVPHKWERDLPVVMEATALSLGVAVAIKHVVHRSRPVDRFCADEKGEVPCRKDTRLSFYSGHTSAAFAAAIATGSIASHHGLEHSGWIWGTQLALATTTGALRVVSDQHFATDVMVGMVTGGLVGWVVPALHKPGESRVVSRAVPDHAPAVLAAVPIALRSGSAMTVTAGVPYGGGVYFGLRWHGL
jgi:membrane-associated phospholipid phosphatase